MAVTVNEARFSSPRLRKGRRTRHLTEQEEPTTGRLGRVGRPRSVRLRGGGVVTTRREMVPGGGRIGPTCRAHPTGAADQRVAGADTRTERRTLHTSDGSGNVRHRARHERKGGPREGTALPGRGGERHRTVRHGHRQGSGARPERSARLDGRRPLGVPAGIQRGHRLRDPDRHTGNRRRHLRTVRPRHRRQGQLQRRPQPHGQPQTLGTGDLRLRERRHRLPDTHHQSRGGPLPLPRPRHLPGKGKTAPR